MIKVFHPIPRLEIDLFYLSYGREESGFSSFHLEVLAIERTDRIGGRSLLFIHYNEEDIGQSKADEAPVINLYLLFFRFSIKINPAKVERLRKQYSRYEEAQE